MHLQFSYKQEQTNKKQFHDVEARLFKVVVQKTCFINNLLYIHFSNSLIQNKNLQRKINRKRSKKRNIKIEIFLGIIQRKIEFSLK